ncbi:Carbohydrate binding module family 20 [Corchorus capsularis]|uniref:Carbohydrate binding module family 20 n=1 Tax=Corchorus capsularis TaxID=210143 RepID=A0A1R3IP38_COCAP|nr:Carbohydrate binding module family 20 [Corchorus capsularis]
MEALTKSFANICSKDQTTPTLLSSTTFLNRSYISFPPSSSSISNVELLGDSNLLRNRLLKQPVASSHFPSRHSKVSGSWETGGTEIQKTERSKTVHVKLQLQKECSFGEQLLLVGNEPILGMWNLSSAIPLTWSEGHLWMVEMDLPVDLSIHFKLILKQSSGDLLWQPGPDRTFQTWETKNTLVVTEDWENAEAQKITEELLLSENEDLLVSQCLEATVEKANTNDLMTAKDSTLCKDEEESIHQRTLSDENQSDGEMWLGYQGGPVLVLGITPSETQMAAEKSLPDELGKTRSPENSLELAADDQNMPETQMAAEKSLPNELGKTRSPENSLELAADDQNMPETEATS